jgi:sulfur carrier protein ThiS
LKIKVKIMFGGVKEQNLDVLSSSTYEELLGSLHINPEIVLIFRGGNPVPLDEKVTLENIEILRVVTGG